ncbi:acyltransferase family protein [Paraburkholderia lycopersici]|uniref:Peptidoglycan/LPS O-acetylase OafA/YrhL, contains acyltransferase and SGNH-hydrolase domains n=1 Tax=Paraburkholderia lycopersici TaxID=416944 RepID=A0A1G6HEH2_9BURK|nr:acyltransferase [Paraburkholderia lycopersici]SDB92553.1 Peptidoglycan/LPS O-acetylase OafA/YrhL, contains acyltransferase and SGNH-hydrolase domains [Paraburkholderia lycopersici]
MQDRVERFATLDGIRAVACFLVVAHHAPDLFPWVPYPGNAYLAVDLFFCLSGFVIARTYGAQLRNGELSPGRFLLNRAIRFYPLYILGLAPGIPRFLAAWHGTAPGALVAFVLSPEILYLPTLGLRDAFVLDTPAWSLSAELLVNGVYARFAFRSPFVWRLLTAISLFAVVAHAAITGDADAGWSSATIPVGWARAALMFSLGTVAQRYVRIHAVPGNAIAAAVLAVAAIALAAPHASAFAAIAVTVIASPVAIYLGARVEPTGVLRTILKLGGRLSYGVYILHLPLIELIRIRLPLASLTRTSAEALGLAFIVVLCAAVWLLERYYVPPAHRLLRGAVDYLARRPRPASFG